MADLTKRRRWEVQLEGRPHVVDVEYAMLSGFMTVLVDGSRLARGWREWQTVVGGAVVAGVVDGHRIEARITQQFGGQEYRFALMVDGQVQPGSDDLPAPRDVRRASLKAFLGLIALVAGVTVVWTLLRS
jgi:Fas apoptotic inhibitory molecule (FAIM1)